MHIDGFSGNYPIHTIYLQNRFHTPDQREEAAAKGQLKVVNTRQKAIQDFSGKASRTNRRNVDARPNFADYPAIYGLKHTDSGYNDVSGEYPDTTRCALQSILTGGHIVYNRYKKPFTSYDKPQESPKQR